jgi:hypothetical protein
VTFLLSEKISVRYRHSLAGQSMLLPQNAAYLPLPTINSYNIISSSGHTADNKLSKFGVAIIGEIDSKLVEKVRLGSLEVLKRLVRQTKLKWNSDCDAIIRDFETVSEKGQRGAYYANKMIKTQIKPYNPLQKNMPKSPICLLSRISNILCHL